MALIATPAEGNPQTRVADVACTRCGSNVVVSDALVQLLLPLVEKMHDDECESPRIPRLRVVV